MPNKSRIDTFNRLWRPTGSWGVVLNIVLLPAVFVIMAWLGKGVEHLPTLIGLYTILAGLFGALFGIRQMGKNAKVEANKEIIVARINDDDEPTEIPNPPQ